MDTVLALFQRNKEFSSLQMLQNAIYRDYGIAAIESANRFRCLFEGSPFHRLGILQKKRTKEEFVILLVKRGVTKNCQEAEEFIRHILRAEIFYTEDKKNSFLLQKENRENGKYFLEYLTATGFN